MVVLGIWDGHDAGAALVVGGRLVAAVNEERFTRRKLEIRFPAASIACCLDAASLRPSDVNAVACCTSDVAKTLGRLWPGSKERYYAVRRRKARPGPLATATRHAKLCITTWGTNRATRALSALALRHDLDACGLADARLTFEDHHRCHALTAAVGSGWREATVITLDGLGDGLSTTVGLFRDGVYQRLAATPASCSLGVLFEHVTRQLNMRELEDEGKVMALADYAAPIADRANPLLDLIAVDGLRLRSQWSGHRLAAALDRIHWSHPSEQFAFMAQRLVERVGVELVRSAVAATGVRRVALAGGVVSNIKMNQRIRQSEEIDDLYVFPHMGDGGLAVGAAWSAAFGTSPHLTCGIDPLALAPAAEESDLLDAARSAGGCIDRPPRLAITVAERLARGDVVIWYQDGMEYGPRALGHRSVLARPDSPAIRDRINRLLKRRVWYQPFCPSMLEADARVLLEDLKGTPDRYMTTAYTVRVGDRTRMGGVISIDGTCRPQILPEDACGRFADLLRAVRDRLGVGVVLNTSMNIHGEPLVRTPAEAVDLFLRSGADALVLGPFLVERGNQGEELPGLALASRDSL